MEHANKYEQKIISDESCVYLVDTGTRILSFYSMPTFRHMQNTPYVKNYNTDLLVDCCLLLFWGQNLA